MENRRQFFRQDFEQPLCANMWIDQVNGEDVKTKSAYVCIKDMSAGGIRFESDLKLPKQRDVRLCFQTTIVKQDVKVNGHIIRKHENENGYYEYGVEFSFRSGREQEDMLNVVNKMAIGLRKGPLRSGCSLCSLKTSCFKSDAEKEKEYAVVT